MNQINSEFSRSAKANDNLFTFTRSFGRDKNEMKANSPDSDENVFAILDEHTPSWNCEIVDMRNIGKMVLLTAAITIDGVTRHGIGTASEVSGSEILRAEKNALTCAAKKFAFIREALVSDHSNPKNKHSSFDFPKNPIAQSLFDLITAKQISIVRSKSDVLSLDSEKECQKVMNCNVGELSRKAASCFISHLESIQSEQPIEVDTALRRAG